MADDGVFRTDNMALATMLTLEGFAYTIVRITERKALWHFREPEDSPESERFDDLIDEFDGWTAKVEPRAFMIRYTEMREELMQTLRASRPGTPQAATG